MKTVPVPGFIGGSAQSVSRLLNVERTINLITNLGDSGTPTVPAGLIQAPGVRPWLMLPSGSVRGLFAQDNRMWAVGGAFQYEIFGNQTAQVLGPVAEDDRPVTWACNGSDGFQLLSCSGQQGYVFDLRTSAFTQIIANGFPLQCRMVDFLGGFAMALWANSNEFSISAAENFLDWDGLDVAKLSFSSNNVVSMRVVGNLAWFHGSLTTEIWYLQGANFPFAPVQVPLIQIGNAATFSVQPVTSSLMWVGQNLDGRGVVFRSQGYEPVKVSSAAVDVILQAQPRLDDALAWTYQERGHTFYVLYLPSNETTWVYDAAAPPAMAWAERAIWDPNAIAWMPHIGRCHCFAFGKHFVGSRNSGAIYELTSDQYQDWVVS